MDNPEQHEMQIRICSKYNTAFVESLPYSKVGISQNVRDGVFPINGLRHQAEGHTCGWYIWAGEVYSDREDFFIPVHVGHLVELCPLVIRYLGLPPSWRFLVGEDGYEDVWQDKSLLDIK